MTAWSFALAGLGILQLYLTGEKLRIGWLVGIATSLLWFAYGLITNQYGFLMSAIVFGITHYRNWKLWQ